ncbi:MAG: hypothetical protein R2733_01130 [Acidimicrobiales bacterium]
MPATSGSVLRSETAVRWDQLARNLLERHATVAAAHRVALLHAHPDRAAQVASDLSTANAGLHLG